MTDCELREMLEVIATKRPEWYSVAGAAVLTSLSQDLVREAVVNGDLPVSNMGTLSRPYYRIRYRDLQDWMERRKAGAIRSKKRVAAKPVSRHLS